MLASPLRWQGSQPYNLRNLVLLVPLCLLLSFGVTMNAQGQEIDEIPSVAPEGENVLPENTTFAADCLLSLNDLTTKGGWALGARLVTRERWGEVLRVDFKIPGEDLSPLVNRVICWRTPAGNLQLNIVSRKQCRGLADCSVSSDCATQNRLSDTSFHKNHSFATNSHD